MIDKKYLDKTGHLDSAQIIEPKDVFQILGEIQEAVGSVPRSLLEDLSERSGVPLAQLYGAITAYPDLKLDPES